MRFGRKITTAIVGLGISTLIPALSSAAEHRPATHARENVRVQVQPAREDHRVVIEHREVDRGRDEHRVEVRRGPDVRVVIPAEPIYAVPAYTFSLDTPVVMDQVPGCVLDTESRFGAGVPIDSIEFVQSPGQGFYDFRLDRPVQGHMIVRVATNGQFLGYM